MHSITHNSRTTISSASPLFDVAQLTSTDDLPYSVIVDDVEYRSASPMHVERRKWSAEISVGGQDVTSLLDYSNDTLADTTRVAVALAARMIRDEELGSDASVVLYKQLSGDAEPKRDRSLYVYRDYDGTIRTQR